ncbi:MAG: anaerobic sulfatase maturase [Candidatus Omnitrophota bacterium]
MQNSGQTPIREKTPIGFHVMAKPIGPACNLDCKYCYYTEKEVLFGKNENFRMSDKVLEAYVKKYITGQPVPEVEFVWQGGEPTLLGVDFFRKAVRLQLKYGKNKRIKNSLQTNGTLFTDEWCEFLKENNFLVGLSLDGPEEIHDRYRVDRGGKPTFDAVMRGLRLLQKHGVEYNVMACVAKETAFRFLTVYRFLKKEGVKFIQFMPIVEREAGARAKERGFHLAGPAALDKEEANTRVTEWSVGPVEYGTFLSGVFDEWVRNDVGNIFVMNFEWALNAWIGNPSPVCKYANRCGRALVLEHNGDIYACDHTVYPDYKLGNILTDDPEQMIERSLASGFGINKESALPEQCRKCEVLHLCRGECPKNRFATAYNNEPGLHYLCAGYKKFFLHIRKHLNMITKLLENGLPASYVMKAAEGPLVIKLNRESN